MPASAAATPKPPAEPEETDGEGTVQGTVERVVHRQGNFIVALVRQLNGGEARIVGSGGEEVERAYHQGQALTIKGRWVTHQQYGRQLQMVRIDRLKSAEDLRKEEEEEGEEDDDDDVEDDEEDEGREADWADANGGYDAPSPALLEQLDALKRENTKQRMQVRALAAQLGLRQTETRDAVEGRARALEAKGRAEAQTRRERAAATAEAAEAGQRAAELRQALERLQAEGQGAVDGGAAAHAEAMIDIANRKAKRAETRAVELALRAEAALMAFDTERQRAETAVTTAQEAQARTERRHAAAKSHLQQAERKICEQKQVHLALRDSGRRAAQKLSGLQNKLAGNSKAAQRKSTKKVRKQQRKKLQVVVERVGRLEAAAPAVEAVARKAAEEAMRLVVGKTATGGDGGRATCTDSGGNDGASGEGDADFGGDGYGGGQGADTGDGAGGGGGTAATRRKNARKREAKKNRKAALRSTAGNEGSAAEVLGIGQRFDALERLVQDTMEATQKRQGPSEMRKDILLRLAKKKMQGLKRKRRNDHECWRNGEAAPNLTAIQPRFTKSSAVRGGKRRHAFYGRLAQQPGSGGRGGGSSGGGCGGGGADSSSCQSGGRGGSYGGGGCAASSAPRGSGSGSGGGGDSGSGSAGRSAPRTRLSDAGAWRHRNRSTHSGGGGGGGGGGGNGSAKRVRRSDERR
jgi:hypothetical protein